MRKIHLGGISHALAEYLAAYPVTSETRVQELNLENVDLGHDGLYNEIVVRFWSCLGKHALSLQRLKIDSPYESKFCYCPEAASVLYRCSNLLYLAYPGKSADGETEVTMAVMLPQLLKSCSGLKEWVIGRSAPGKLRKSRLRNTRNLLSTVRARNNGIAY